MKVCERHFQVLHCIIKTPGAGREALCENLPYAGKSVALSIVWLRKRGYIDTQRASRHAQHWASERGIAAATRSGYPPYCAKREQVREVHQQTALRLEQRHFWRRAAHQWLRVMDLSTDERERAEAVAKREHCMRQLTQRRQAPLASVMATDDGKRGVYGR